jgi:hypothetical protein
MTFYDVDLNNSEDLSYLLMKDCFTIPFKNDINEIDLRDKMPSLDNYELLGSIANSLATLIEYDIPNYKCSRMFLYYNQRLDTDTYNLHHSIKSLLKYGFCSNDDYPYKVNDINIEPPVAIYQKANDIRFKFEMMKIKKTLKSLCASLINNEPIIMTIRLFESFHLTEISMKIPESNEKEVGGISIIICGFSMYKQVFIIQLLNKYYEIPFLYLLDSNLSSSPFIFIMRNFININTTTDRPPTINEETFTPIKLDLRNKFPEVYDQGKIGSCTANALCSIYEYDTYNFKGSRLFLYYNERLLLNETDIDNGAYLSDGIFTLKTFGLCEEKDWPYIIENLFKRPTDDIYQKAKINFVTEAFSIANDVKTIKYWLNKNEPIALGIAVYSNFMNFSAAKSGDIGLPSANDRFIGGHAIVLCGYDDDTQKFILRNSWGSYWGNNGYFYLPYNYITNDYLCGDLWVITKIRRGG